MARETPTLLKRNVLIHGDENIPLPRFVGEWVAVPREDFDFTRNAVNERAALRDALRKWETWALAHPHKATIVRSVLDETRAALALGEETKP